NDPRKGGSACPAPELRGARASLEEGAQGDRSRYRPLAPVLPGGGVSSRCAQREGGAEPGPARELERSRSPEMGREERIIRTPAPREPLAPPAPSRARGLSAPCGAERVNRAARCWSALNPLAPAGQPGQAGVAAPRVPRGGHPERAGGFGQIAAPGSRPSEARRWSWEARGGRGAGDGGGRAASPGRSRRAARRGAAGAERAGGRAPPSPD
ncbi:hypothetical protein P7K49_030580, partial [Saguinus oedipus]